MMTSTHIPNLQLECIKDREKQMSNKIFCSIGDQQHDQEHLYVNSNGKIHLNSLILIDTISKNTNASKQVLDYVYTKLYEFEDFACKIIDEKCKIIEQLERGLFSVSQKDANIYRGSISDEVKIRDNLISELNERINKYENEIFALKNTIKEQDNVILSHNKNLIELKHTNDAIIKSKEEAFKIQTEEINKKQKLNEDQQRMIESLKTQVENLEDSFELSKIFLEKQLSDKEIDLNTKVETYVANLYYGHKYFEEILGEKDRILKEKIHEMNQMKVDFENKIYLSNQHTETRLNQCIDQLKIEIEQKNAQIEQLKQHFEKEMNQIMSKNAENCKYEEYYRVLNAKIHELSADIESKDGLITKLKDEVLNRDQIIGDKDKLILIQQNQLKFSEVKINDSKQSDDTDKKVKEKLEFDIKNVKNIYEHQIELHTMKINMLEKSIKNYQKCYNDLSQSSDSVFNIETSTESYKKIINDLQKTTVLLETEKIEYQVKINYFEEQIKQLGIEKENLIRKHKNDDGERQKLKLECDTYALQYQAQIQQRENELKAMSEANSQLNTRICSLELDLMGYDRLKQECNQFVVNYEQMSKQLIESRNEIELLNTKIDNLVNNNARINRENVKFEIENKELKEKFEIMCKDLVDFNSFKQELSDIYELSELNRQLNVELNEKNELIQQLNDAMDYLETKNSQLFINNIKMQLFIENIGYSIENVDKSAIVEQYEELLRIKENKRLKNDEILLKDQQNHNKSEMLSQYEKDNDELREKVNQLTQNRNEIFEEIDSYKRIITEREKTISDLQKTIKEINNEHELKNVDLAKLKSELDCLKNDLTIYTLNSNLKIDKLERELNKRTFECDELTKLLNQKDNELRRFLKKSFLICKA